MKRGFILLSSIFIVLFLGIFMGIALMRSSSQMRLVETRRASMYALYAAEAGIERAIFELRLDINWGDGIPADQPIPEFQDVEVRLNPDDPTTIVGRYSIFSNGDRTRDDPWIIVPLRIEGQDVEPRVTRIIDAEIQTQTPAAFFVSTLGDLRIGSGATIGSHVLGRDIYFEVSDSLPPESRRITLDGNLIYLRNISGYDPEDPDPNITITGNVEQGEPMTFVGVDLARYENLAGEGGRNVSEDFIYSGEINRDDLETPNGVLFVEDDVYIEGDVTESVLIVSGGDIHITGDITYSVADTQIGLFAGNNIIIDAGTDDDCQINGLLVADGGTFKAEGEKGSKNQLDFNGAISLRGREEERTVIDLNVYSVRNYVYDSNLFFAPQIPFMAFIADLRKWEEM